MEDSLINDVNNQKYQIKKLRKNEPRLSVIGGYIVSYLLCLLIFFRNYIYWSRFRKSSSNSSSIHCIYLFI